MLNQTQDPMLDISRGITFMTSHVNKFGSNTDIQSGTTEDIWDVGGTYSFPTTADITHISQAVDQEAMRGKIIEVQGLDASWNFKIQSAVLNGSLTTTAVALATPLIRVFRMRVLANVVTDQILNLKNVGGGTTYASIQAGKNQTLMAIYTVPAGFTGYMTSYYGDYVRDAVKDPDSVSFGLWSADRNNSYAFQIKHLKGIPKQAPGFQHFFTPYAKFTQKTDIKLTGTPSAAGAHVHGGFDIILIDNQE